MNEASRCEKTGDQTACQMQLRQFFAPCDVWGRIQDFANGAIEIKIFFANRCQSMKRLRQSPVDEPAPVAFSKVGGSKALFR